MKRLPIWFERIENLAIAATVVVVFVRLHFSWWWLPVFFLAFDASMAGYLVNNRVGAICYNLAHAYVAPAVLLLSYVLSATRWCAFAGLLWAFHIAGDRVGGYGLKFATGFQDTHLGRIGKRRLPGRRASRPSRKRAAKLITSRWTADCSARGAGSPAPVVML
jgi:Domain of unknown function (DUF4260)